MNPTKSDGRRADHVSRYRLNVRIAGAIGQQLAALAHERRRSQANIVETALLSLFSPDAVDRRSAEVTRRLDRQSRQLERLQHDFVIVAETLALFVRYYMTVAPALPETQQAAARAKGAERFSVFTETLTRRLAEDKTLLADLHLAIHPRNDEFRTAEDVASLTEGRHAGP